MESQDRRRFKRRLEDKFFFYSTHNSPYSIFALDINGKILYCNAKAEKLLDLKISSSDKNLQGSIEEPGQEEKFLVFVRKGAQLTLRQLVKETLSGAPLEQCLVSFTNRKGKTIGLYLSAILLKTVTNTPECIAVIASDVSDQELTIRQEAELYNQYILRTERHRIMAQAAVAVAHDLRNLISTTLLSAEILQDNRFNLSPQAKECVETVVGNATAAAEIVGHLLGFTKERLSALEPKKIQDQLKMIVKLITTKCRKQNIVLKTEISDELPPVLIDDSNLRAAFLNLLFNSIEAMQEGGTLTLKCLRGETPQKVLVTIEDTGPGITSEQLNNLGKPFFTTKEEGAGIGFYIAKQIFEYHKAYLEVRTNPNNKGLKISITFPAVG